MLRCSVLGDSVFAALPADILVRLLLPQLRLATEALGYDQASGDVSRFQVCMAGEAALYTLLPLWTVIQRWVAANARLLHLQLPEPLQQHCRSVHETFSDAMQLSAYPLHNVLHPANALVLYDQPGSSYGGPVDRVRMRMCRCGLQLQARVRGALQQLDA